VSSATKEVVMAVNHAKSYLAKPGEVEARWYLVDATGQVLGRLATRLATILMGKHKPRYTPHVLTGDCIVVINAEKVRLTGRKPQTKAYDRYTYYPGGRKVIPFETMIQRHPDRVIRLAVKRMLPDNKLGAKMLSRLKVYRGPKHEHAAQKPQPLAV